MTVAAVFPSWVPLNDAVLRDGAGVMEATRLAGVYDSARVGVWALWLLSTAADLDATDRVRDLGTLKRDATTLVMQATPPSGLRRDDRVLDRHSRCRL